MEELDRDLLFVGLTRPQMVLGVTYGYIVVNIVVTTEFFLLFKSPWVLLVAIAVHLVGWLASLRDPRIFDLWLTKARLCARVRNYRVWGCNSYRA